MTTALLTLVKKLCYPLLKVDERPPTIPDGHENDPDVQVVRASPKFWELKLMIWRIYTGMWAVIFSVAAVVIALSDYALYGFLILAAFGVVAVWKLALMYVIARLDYEMRWYAITSTSVRVRSGVLIMKEVTISFRNAQNVQVKQGPIERLFGISTLQIDTAGGGSPGKQEPGQTSHRAELRGLEDVAGIREQVLAILRTARHTGLGDPDDHAHDNTPLFSEVNVALLHEIARETSKLRGAAE